MQEYDVLIVGAGLSGIGAAYHLRRQCPGCSFHILEAREQIGGTWDLFRYPGIRSDSDMYTLGYEFKPWLGGKVLADGPAIREYVCETAEENDILPRISFGLNVQSADWSSADKRWTLTADANGEQREFRCRLLLTCAGYYRYDQGYMPEYPGGERFKGELFHPQHWPEDLDYTGKRVVVIGSGATAVTLVPAMADDVASMTMLQRSPTYFAPGENRNELADSLRELEIPEEWVHEIVRRRILKDSQEITRRSFEEPEALKAELLEGARAFLGDQFDIEKHFTPSYRPWQQRLAFIPDGDMFQAIAAGKASVVTDHIDRFVPEGVRLTSGEVLKADIIVTATGFNLCVLGDINFRVDGRPVDFADTVTYRGMMFTGVPNLVWVFGYFRASWTLRADLISEFVVRLLQRMDQDGHRQVTPALRDSDSNMPHLPWIDPDNFNPGYLMRSMHLMPKQGDHAPWVFTQDYWKEKDEIPAADLDDGALQYG